MSGNSETGNLEFPDGQQWKKQVRYTVHEPCICGRR
jgi:hypothetical protein